MSSEQEAGDDEKIESLLTERQARVLQLRLQGLSLREVAEIMGTTRANISKLERRARQNIMIAKRTIHDWMKVQAPISVFVPVGTDVLRVPAMVFKAADMEGLHLPVNSIDMIVQLKAKSPSLFKDQTLQNDAEIFITLDGNILLIDEKAKPFSPESE